MLLAKQDYETLNLNKLDEQTKNEILTMKNDLILTDEKISDFGKNETKKISSFSNEVLKFVKLKDTPEVEGMILDLMNNINSVNPDSLLDKKPNFLKRLFKIDDIKSFAIKYESVSSIIDSISLQLQSTQYQLKKDIELCSQYLEANSDYIDSLDKCIIAGKMKYNEEIQNLNELKNTVDPTDTLAVEELAIKEDNLNRFERKLFDLELMRAVAIQNIPQIRLIKDGDAVLIEKIDNSISSAIPLWESQMVIAISLLRQQSGLKIQKSVAETTNKLIERNSEMLKRNSIEVAKQLEEGIVDVEVLKKSSQNLIDTLQEIKKVRAEGIVAREKASKELVQLQTKLNSTLLIENK